ncbi:MAG: YhcH/YjgK/YiaL family protein [Clostridia bacterium]|nr:YhcH/YjgK/YiaL family protein [Clostridia bacterium]
MILDLISRLPLYAGLIPGAAQIAAAFAADDPALAPCEVREKAYATKPDDQRRFEIHDHTIDLMIARAGAEVIHICPPEGMEPAEELKDDGRKLNGPVHGTAALLSAGYFCAIFPGEAHAVGGHPEDRPGEIDKWVVKVRL